MALNTTIETAGTAGRMMAAVNTKLYDVICKRQDTWYKLERVAQYQPALVAAKEAIKDKKNEEVRIIESIYDKSTKKEKTTVTKILKQEALDEFDFDIDPDAKNKARANARKTRADVVRNRINSLMVSAAFLVVAIVIVGLFVNWLRSYWQF